MSAQRAVIVAADEVRLSSSTARLPEPASTFAYTCRPTLSSATLTPCSPRVSWSTAMTSLLVRIEAVVELIVARLLPASTAGVEPVFSGRGPGWLEFGEQQAQVVAAESGEGTMSEGR